MTAPTSSLKTFAPAKVNLALHVVGQREDGYHLLDTLVAFTDVGDELSLSPADSISLDINGPEGSCLSAGSDNLVLKAAHLLQDYAGSKGTGASIVLTKNLPVASGIGGGSSDCAAVMHGLNRLWDLQIDEKELAVLGLKLGADVPMCLAGKPLRAQGIGENITNIRLASLPLVLVNPRVAVSTPEIFSKLPEKSNPAMTLHPSIEKTEDCLSFLRAQRNDLETTAIEHAPEIEKCLNAITATGAKLARMSGSGATCFGIMADGSPQEAAKAIKKHHPDWWVVPTRTLV